MIASETEAAPGRVNQAEAGVGAVLDSLTTFRVRWWAPILLGTIMLFDSWDSIAIAYVMPSLVKEWGLGPASSGTLISSGYIGQFLGAMLLGSLAERYGRLPVFTVSVGIMGALALACAFAPNYEVLFAIRLVQGLAIGGAIPVAITYINELAPTKTRGRYFAIYQWLSMSGYAVASLASTVIIPHLGWRWLFGLGAMPLVLMPLVLLTLPESPRWLARIGRIDAARAAIAKLGGTLGSIAQDSDGPAPVGPKIRPSELFSPALRRRTTAILLIWFLTYFANFGLTTWIPTIYTTVFKVPVAEALLYAALPAVLFLVAIPVAGAVMDTTGRRPVAIIGALAAAAALLLLTQYKPSEIGLLVALIATGQVGSSVAAFVIWPYTAESYPTHVRAIGLGVCSSIARGASMLTPIFVGVILAKGASIDLVFGVFGIFALAVALLWKFATVETARIRLETL